MSEEGRYVIQAFDECAWSIIDTTTLQVYALGYTRLSNLIVHVFLVELSTAAKSRRYLSYKREILGCRMEVSHDGVATQVIDFILNELEDGADVDNPIDTAFRLGADLHGQSVGWPEQRAH